MSAHDAEWHKAADDGRVSSQSGPFPENWSQADSQPDRTEQDRENRKLREDGYRLREQGFPMLPCYYD